MDNNVIDHPRLPPPESGMVKPLDEAAIRKHARSMRFFFDGLIAEYPRAALSGKLPEWSKAAHAFIDMMGDS